MTDPQEKLKAFVALRPEDYGFLVDLSLSQRENNDGGIGLILTIRLAKTHSYDKAKRLLRAGDVLTITFRSVSLFKTLRDMSAVLFVSPLVIRINRADQLEVPRYRVIDAEEEAISLYCEDFDASVER
jgi:hypothetical protein